MKKRIPDSIFAVIACLLWSSAFVGIKTGYASGISPLLFAGIRFFLSGVVISAVTLIRSGPAQLLGAWKEHGRFIILVGFFQTALAYGPFYIGVSLVPASIAAIVIGASPLLTSAASSRVPPIEKLTPKRWIALAAAIIGLVILSISRNAGELMGQQQTGMGEVAGILLLLAAVSSTTVGSMLVSRTRRSIPTLSLSGGQFLAGGMMLIAAGLVLEPKSAVQVDLSFFVALSWLIMVSSVGITLWFWLLAVRKAAAGAISVWKFLIPVVGALLGWLMMPHDKPDMGSLIGMACIAAGVLVFFAEPRRKT